MKTFLKRTFSTVILLTLFLQFGLSTLFTLYALTLGEEETQLVLLMRTIMVHQMKDIFTLKSLMKNIRAYT